MNSSEQAWEDRARESIRQARALADEAEKHIAGLDATRQAGPATDQSNKPIAEINPERLFKSPTPPQPETPPTDPRAALLIRLTEAHEKLRTTPEGVAGRSEREYWKSQVEELNNDLARLDKKEETPTPQCVIA